MIRNFQRVLFIVVLIVPINGCLNHQGYAPVSGTNEEKIARNTYYVVQKGDTLYSIAFNYGLDYRELANNNNIPEPYTIYAEQRLLVTSSKKTRSKSRAKFAKPKLTKDSKKVNTKLSKQTQLTKKNWRWPLSGDIVQPFSLTGKMINKGIDIQGHSRESVVATTAGVVVYAAAGLRGYRKLIIIKHDGHLLSAYGLNRKILVKEGDKVKGGQVVAEVDSKEPDQALLHFEIRRYGKPENPLAYLSDRRKR